MANNSKCLYCNKTLKNGKMLKLHKIRMHGFQENGIKNKLSSENGKSQILEDNSFTSILNHYTEQNSKPNLEPNLELNLKPNFETNSEQDPLDTTKPKMEPMDTEVQTKEEIPPPPLTMPVSQTAKKFKCDTCDKLFKTKMYLAIHMYNTHDRVVFPEISEKNVENTISKIICDNTNTPNHDTIDQIQEGDTEEKFQIELEKVKSEPRKNPDERLAEDEYEKINNSENPELNCDLCNKSFLDYESYCNHYKRVHNEKKSFKCSLCDNKFTTKRSIYSHIQSVHSGVREHKCDLCGILFSKFSNLNSHYDAVHEKIKNHKCTECGKSFSQKSNLKTHLDYVHR